MRLIDADALLKYQEESDKISGVMLVVSKGYILDAPTISPEPDPETGLVSCGCGGKPTFCHLRLERDDGYYFECPKCRARSAIRIGREGARDSWNQSRGYFPEETK